MQLIVDIPDNEYKHIREYYEKNDNVEATYSHIYYGIPLPKGHGRLIDADYLREDFKASKRISFAERMDISCIVDHAPTIIEADKGE